MFLFKISTLTGSREEYETDIYTLLGLRQLLHGLRAIVSLSQRHEFLETTWQAQSSFIHF